MKKQDYSTWRYVAFSVGFSLLMVASTLVLRSLLSSEHSLWSDMLFPVGFCAVFLPLYLRRYGPVLRPRCRSPLGEVLHARKEARSLGS